MSCVFSYHKKDFDAVAFLQSHPISPEPYDADAGYFVADASVADFYDFDEQKQDAIDFLQRNHATLQHLLADGEGDAMLDFGIADLISEGEVACQSEYLPAELLRLAGTLGIDIGISRYPISNEEQDGEERA